LGEGKKEEDFTLIERAKTKECAGQQRRADPICTIFHRVGQSQAESPAVGPAIQNLTAVKTPQD
jgi:hypothetical protein